MASPLVSIVTPFFNAEAFLRDAINSVVLQTYPHWEILLVDDGSEDASPAIALAAQAKHGSRFRYLQHSDRANHGAGPSRTLALAHATGDFVAFLDADDVWFPAKLARQVHALSSRPDVDLLCGRTLFWYSAEPDGERDHLHGLPLEGGSVHRPPTLLPLLLRHEEVHPANCGLLIRRRACDQHGGFDERVPRLYEDTVFLAKLFLFSRVMVASECVAAYRIHAASTCHKALGSGYYSLTGLNRAREDFLRWLEFYLDECGCDDREVWWALRRQLLPYRYPRLYQAAQKAKPSIEWLRNRLPQPAIARAPPLSSGPLMEPDQLTAARRQLELALGAAEMPARSCRKHQAAAW